MTERKLRSGVNWQGALEKKKRRKTKGVKQGLGKFIYRLFNDAVISSDYIALWVRTTVNSELQTSVLKGVLFQHLCVKVLRKTMQLLRIAAVPAVIRKQYIPNTNQKSYHLSHFAG